jgi:hypothetical protein
MALFEFELRDPAEITPWGNEAEGLHLSWFALTDGWFRMPVGDQALFEYSDKLRHHCGFADPRPDYQIASFARDMLLSVMPAMAPLPPRIERLAGDWDAMKGLEAACFALDETDDPDRLAYDAWRWLGERSPWTSYLAANPQISFVRIGNDVRIHWDNRNLEIKGIAAWTAGKGMHAIPVDVFREECREFSDRLLEQMARRIDSLETGKLRARIPVSCASLRTQHDEWVAEFAGYFKPREPDLSWTETERALATMAEKLGAKF